MKYAPRVMGMIAALLLTTTSRLIVLPASAQQADGRDVQVPEAEQRRPATPAAPRARGTESKDARVIVDPRDYALYPWTARRLGLGYTGYYDPWFGAAFLTYAAPAPGESFDGALRLKVKPKDATVIVDGHYAGTVDDFDGVFQKLRLESGPHHLEIGARDRETLTVDVQIEVNQTTTYRGELKPER